MRRQQASVGGNAVARLQQHDVTGHQQRRVQFNDLPSAPHPRIGRQHVLQRRQGLFRAVFLIKAQRGVQHHDDENHHGIFQIAHRPGQYGRKQQHDDQEVLELIEEFQQ